MNALISETPCILINVGYESLVFKGYKNDLRAIKNYLNSQIHFCELRDFILYQLIVFSHDSEGSSCKTIKLKSSVVFWAYLHM
jgi:hypothetical protein